MFSTKQPSPVAAAAKMFSVYTDRQTVLRVTLLLEPLARLNLFLSLTLSRSSQTLGGATTNAALVYIYLNIYLTLDRNFRFFWEPKAQCPTSLVTSCYWPPGAPACLLKKLHFSLRRRSRKRRSWRVSGTTPRVSGGAIKI